MGGKCAVQLGLELAVVAAAVAVVVAVVVDDCSNAANSCLSSMLFNSKELNGSNSASNSDKLKLGFAFDVEAVGLAGNWGGVAVAVVAVGCLKLAEN